MADANEPRGQGFCELIGCAGESVGQRWVVVGQGEERQIEVCWKHVDGELDPDLLRT